MTQTLFRRLIRLLPKQLVGWLAYHDPRRRTTMSQFAEDVALARLLPQARGFYVDIGAFHPKFGSNTYFLWKRGWRGINIDVDDYKIALFRRYRPGDTNLTTGVSSANGERTFYFQEGGSYGSMSSFDSDFATNRGERFGRSVQSRSVPVRTLNSLLEEHLPRDAEGKPIAIDLITIDVEGHELDVFRGFDFARYEPRCLCVEIHATSIAELMESPTFELLRSHGYELTAWPAPSCIFMRTAVVKTRSAQTPSKSKSQPLKASA